MNILIYSPFFLPKIGGLENMAAMLAKEFQASGENVKVVTFTEDTKENLNSLPYEVHRNPSMFELLKLTKWCNLFFQLNISLKGLWPLLIYKRHYVVSHQTHHFYNDGSTTLAGKMKQLVSHFAFNICCSSYVAKLLPAKTVVIPNCYDADTFKNYEKDRPFELIFVGRLVSDKGCDLIIESLSKLKKENILPILTIVGVGPEEIRLRRLITLHNLEKQVNFTGAKKGAELVQIINSHQVMIVPSIWEEPFGIVALEGLACGCKMIVAKVGGLPEAIGEYGLFFEKQNTDELSEKIKIALYNAEQNKHGSSQFLAQHSAKQVSASYLSAIKLHFKHIDN